MHRRVNCWEAGVVPPSFRTRASNFVRGNELKLVHILSVPPFLPRSQISAFEFRNSVQWNSSLIYRVVQEFTIRSSVFVASGKGVDRGSLRILEDPWHRKFKNTFKINFKTYWRKRWHSFKSWEKIVIFIYKQKESRITIFSPWGSSSILTDTENLRKRSKSISNHIVVKCETFSKAENFINIHNCLAERI